MAQGNVVPISSNVTETGHDIEVMLSAYLEAIQFTEGGPDYAPEEDAEQHEFSNQATALARCECALFLYRNAHYIQGADPRHLGHDFWMTRNGHGVGFWDGDWPEPLATALDDYCQQIGPIGVEIGDDGLIHFTQA